MTNRTWVYDQMVNDATLLTYVGTSIVTDPMNTPGDPLDDVTTVTPRVHQSTSINVAPTLKPFIMYRQTSDVEFFRGDDGDTVRSCGFMIFCHDAPGDYMQIDEMIDALQTLFKDTNDPTNGIVRSRWSNTSEDLRDDDMGTITRFASIQVLYRV